MKRTGANSLLFPESQHDACLDGSCWKGKVAKHLEKSLERNPKLIQVSSNWGSHSNGVLGRGDYVEIIKTASRNGHGKLQPERKKCAHITQAIVVEGGNIGQVVDVCANPGCEVPHAEARRSREAQDRIRNDIRKQEEQRKQELATRIRVLDAVLEKVAWPLLKADLDLVAREFANRLPQEYRTILSRRHAVMPVDAQKTQTTETGPALKNLDETGYGSLLIELSLLDATYSVYSRDGAERLEAVAKRYRVNVSKITESVAAEFTARRKKRDQRKKARAHGKTDSPKRAQKR